MHSTRYDGIGGGYADFRREDPELLARIEQSLGDARSVVNVGAGAGSYEPRGRRVFPVEPSEVMAKQRPPDRGPAIRGVADALPFHDQSVDAAMSVLSLHHWHPDQEKGIREMCRVARDRIAVVTIDARVCGRMWLIADYFPEAGALDDATFPFPETIGAWMDRPWEVEILPVSRATPDWMMLSYWAWPERVLDEAARSATSAFARQPRAVVERVVAAVRRDLESGAWDARYGALRELDACDVGLRLVAARRA